MEDNKSSYTHRITLARHIRITRDKIGHAFLGPFENHLAVVMLTPSRELNHHCFAINI